MAGKIDLIRNKTVERIHQTCRSANPDPRWDYRRRIDLITCDDIADTLRLYLDVPLNDSFESYRYTPRHYICQLYTLRHRRYRHFFRQQRYAPISRTVG